MDVTETPIVVWMPSPASLRRAARKARSRAERASLVHGAKGRQDARILRREATRLENLAAEQEDATI